MKKQAIAIKRLKYPWLKNGKDRFDLVMMGEPDCHAYIIRYWSENWKSAAWCWILTMPRTGVNGERIRGFHGFGRSGHAAKRQVEQAIEESWI
jgi:hypothetical protein